MDAGPIQTKPLAGTRAGSGATFLLLALGGFAVGANMRITDPLLPTLALEFDTTVGAAAIVATVYALAHGALQVVYGPLGDRHGKLLIVAFAAIAAAAVSAASAFANSLGALAFLRLLSGLAAAAIVPLTLAFIGDSTSYAERHAALARYSGATTLGITLGQVFAGVIADQWGWRAVFVLIAAVFAVAGSGLLLARDRPMAPAPVREGRGANLLREPFALLKRPVVRGVLIAVGIEGAIAFTMTAFVGAHLHDRFGLSLGAIGLHLGLFGAGAVAYTLVTAQTMTRLGERGVLALGGVLFGACFLVMTFADWRAFGPLLFLAGIGLMMVHNALQAHATQMAPEARGAALSLFATMLFFGQTAGFAGASLVYDFAGAVPLFVAAGIGFPVLAFRFRRRAMQA